MLDFVQQLVSGIALGCVYGLIALGFVLVYKATEVVNFAQGDLVMPITARRRVSTRTGMFSSNRRMPPT